MFPRPRVLLRASLEQGAAVVAAAHAGLAWQLRNERLGWHAALELPFMPNDFERVPEPELRAPDRRCHRGDRWRSLRDGRGKRVL